MCYDDILKARVGKASTLKKNRNDALPPPPVILALEKNPVSYSFNYL